MGKLPRRHPRHHRRRCHSLPPLTVLPSLSPSGGHPHAAARPDAVDPSSVHLGNLGSLRGGQGGKGSRKRNRVDPSVGNLVLMEGGEEKRGESDPEAAAPGLEGGHRPKGGNNRKRKSPDDSGR